MFDISVIIPVSTNHIKYLSQAIASVKAQDIESEIIVINDSAEIIEIPDVILLDSEESGSGPSRCRNIGASVATGEVFVFLDADDMLVPGSLKRLWEVYKQTGTVVYGDLIRSDNMEIFRFKEPYYGSDLEQSVLKKPNRPITCLIPREVYESIGGWDENVALWEDIEFNIATGANGFCETYTPYPIYYYRLETGERRILAEKDEEIKESARNYIYNKYREYYRGEKEMPCNRGCGKPKFQNKSPQQNQVQKTLPNILQLMEDVDVYLEYIDPRPETKTIKGSHTGKEYRVGKNVERLRMHKVGYDDGEMHPLDAQALVAIVKQGYNLFRVLMKEKPTPIKLQPRPSVKAARSHKEVSNLHIKEEEMEALRAEIAAAYEAV